MWYCLPDSLSYFSCNPETASRVTLALLGTVFQTAFLTTCCNPETASRVTLALLGTVFQTALTVLLRLRLARLVQNLSRITWMRRICSFHGFFSFGFVCACRALGFSRIITCSVLCSRLISCFVV